MDEKTGEEIFSPKKFHKSSFDEIMKDEIYKKYVDFAIEKAYTVNSSHTDNSEEEVFEGDE